MTSGPIAGFDIPFGAGDGTWSEAGQYCVWSQRFAYDEVPLNVLERTAGIVKEAPAGGTSLRLIPAGTPHRLSHLFGFWRESDADTLFFRSLQDADVRYALVASVGATTYRSEQLFWACAECGAELQRHAFDAKRFGLPAFWAFALERVRDFNAGDAARTCARCSAVHRRVYGFDRNTDTESEQAARKDF